MSRSSAHLRAGLLLGVGLGGFVDGIVLHQILQWHAMVSSMVPPVDLVSSKVNMFWDGVFHALMWLVTVTGLQQLWRAGREGNRPPGLYIFGAALLGWALFNGVEGVLHHHLIGLHHVREFVVDRAIWDYGFLGVSIVIGACGFLLMRRSGRSRPTSSAQHVP